MLHRQLNVWEELVGVSHIRATVVPEQDTSNLDLTINSKGLILTTPRCFSRAIIGQSNLPKITCVIVDDVHNVVQQPKLVEAIGKIKALFPNIRIVGISSIAANNEEGIVQVIHKMGVGRMQWYDKISTEIA